MLEILHTIAGWYVGILIFVLIVFWLVLWPFGLIEPVIGFFVDLFSRQKTFKSPYKLKVPESSLRFHEANVRSARNRQFTQLDSPTPSDAEAYRHTSWQQLDIPEIEQQPCIETPTNHRPNRKVKKPKRDNIRKSSNVRRNKTWNFQTWVAGAHYRQAEIAYCQKGQDVLLLRDPDNMHDENAIEIWANDMHIGFIPKEEAVRLAWAMDKGDHVEAHIERFYIENRGNKEVWLRVQRIDASLLDT